MPDLWQGARRAVRRAAERFGIRSTPDRVSDFVVDYDQVFDTLSRVELYDDPTPLTEADLSTELLDRTRRGRHFLGLYSEHGGRLAFERYGFLDLLREKGFDPQIVGDVSDPDEHRLRIHDGEASPDRLLIELAVGLSELTLPDGTDGQFLFINWLMMQDPRKSFPPGRPALPDQRHPGLGLFEQFGYLLHLIGVRLGCDGLTTHPAHFHNAVLYGRFMRFVDPVVEGRFRALERDLAAWSLADATDALEHGRIFHDDGSPVTWTAEPQVMPITERARAWFDSAAYQDAVAQAQDAWSFHWNGEPLVERRRTA